VLVAFDRILLLGFTT